MALKNFNFSLLSYFQKFNGQMSPWKKEKERSSATMK